MKDHDKSKDQLIKELQQLRQTITELQNYKQETLEYQKELQQITENFKDLADNATDGIIIACGPLKHVYVNKQMEKISGYSKNELLKMTIQDLISPEDFLKVKERYEKRLAGENIPQRYEADIIRKDGQRIPMEIAASKTTWHNQPASFGFFQDISNRKKTEKERESLIKELENKNSELERFTYTVSHDLRSPLITIKGFLGMLEKDLRSGNLDLIKSDIKRISSATDKMHLLLMNLLELSRIGRIVNPPVFISMKKMVDEVIELLQGYLAQQKIMIKISPNLPDLYGDKPRLQEVMQNLLENAIKFMTEQPEPIIEVGGWKEANKVTIFVQDNGLGIESQYKEKVFDLFEQLNQSVEGTGIGLALVKRIIEFHHGRVWVESAGLNKGSKFCFEIPQQ